MIDITVKIGGEAGFGIMTTGLFMGKIAIRSGFHAFEYAEYPSLIRGGHNSVVVRISEKVVYSQEKGVDILICLNEETYKLHKDEVKEGGVIVLDEDKIKLATNRSEQDLTYIHLPFAKIIGENGFSNVMINNIALGALMHIIGADIKILHDLIAENFARKNQDIIDKNINAAKLGFQSMKTSFPKGYKTKILKKGRIVPRIYISGNEMIGVGAVAAQCRMYVAYPMTPTSALLHFLAGKAEKSGMVVKHAEDEISVINMALGASWAGVRSMVGTSGGGFALMVEAVSLAGMTETPIVIVMGQRPGPATGMPTWTEQGDLLFILHSGHGEFPKIILAPGDMEETYVQTVEAFNLADKYQTPVFILVDKYIQEGYQSIDESRIKNYELRIERGKLLTQEELLKTAQYKRYQLTDDGISPRVMPGMKNSLHQANSYEHLEDGHTTEESEERSRQVEKRNRKAVTFLKEDAKMPVLHGAKNSPLTVISWGSTKGPVLQAMKDTGNKFNLLHFSYLWPLPKKELKKVLSGLEKVLLVENNSTAQFGQLLTMETGIEFENKLLKYSGRPIYPEEIIEKIKELT